MKEYDIIIIGAGPAGITAGIYAGRENLKTLVLERTISGGLVNEAPLIENYPGFEAIAGAKLAEKMKTQASKYVNIKETEEVKKIEPIREKMAVFTEKEEYITKTLIMCTGTKHRKLGVKGEEEFLGRGISYCATCDGFFFKNKNVMVVGGGNSAVEEALYLKNIGCNVTLIHRRDELRAQKHLQDKLHKAEIPILWNSQIKEIKGDKAVKSVVIRDKKNAEREISTDAVFIYIGEEPNNKLAAKMGIELDKHGYIITDKSQRTNVPKVYAAGDITGGVKQVVVACAEGAVAAISAYVDLMKEK